MHCFSVTVYQLHCMHRQEVSYMPQDARLMRAYREPQGAHSKGLNWSVGALTLHVSNAIVVRLRELLYYCTAQID